MAEIAENERSEGADNEDEIMVGTKRTNESKGSSSSSPSRGNRSKSGRD